MYNHVLIDQLIQSMQASGEGTRQIAKKIGIARTLLFKLKEGRGSPTVRSLQTIADYFDVPLPFLLVSPDTTETVQLMVKLLHELEDAPAAEQAVVTAELERLLARVQKKDAP